MILTTEILVLTTVNLVYEGIARAQVDSGAGKWSVGAFSGVDAKERRQGPILCGSPMAQRSRGSRRVSNPTD